MNKTDEQMSALFELIELAIKGNILKDNNFKEHLERIEEVLKLAKKAGLLEDE